VRWRYRARQGIRSDEVAIAVIVQQLVPADVAGVLFTANPLTGARNQIVINAAWGLGEAIVGGLSRPTTSRQQADGCGGISDDRDKEVMTVRLPAGPAKKPYRPVSAGSPRSNHVGAELAGLGVRIEQLYGHQWILNGPWRAKRLFILQARPITALPEARMPLQWKLPRAGGRYVRKAVVELLPDPLSPLSPTLALPCWNKSMRGLMKRLAHVTQCLSHVRLITINDYAYYDFGMTARSGRAPYGLFLGYCGAQAASYYARGSAMGR